MQSIIEVNNLSKRYQIGVSPPYLTLRDSLMELPRFLFGDRVGPKSDNGKNEFWALRDVSFSIKAGEVLGVIGRNGAGKSTLLKILSRITYPTSGEVRLRGRVASLLEVGTGFSPELTGRENIFLNGAILGMARREIVRKLDEIIAFAEIEKFLDTPVKRYSSGMYTRLAFSVAAHLEPDILLVDEVLAVGDFEFQQKCLGKMEQVKNQEGRTIIFVSHNMRMVEQLCDTCLLLDNGRIIKTGRSGEVINYYLRRQKRENPTTVIPVNRKKEAQITKLTIRNASGQPSASVPISEGFAIEVDYRVNHPVRNCVLALYLYSRGELLLLSTEGDKTGYSRHYSSGKYKARIQIPAFLFQFGDYSFDVALMKPGIETVDKVSGIGFEITNHNNPKNRIINGIAHDKLGVILDYELVPTT